MYCLDVYIWKPERCNAANRNPTNAVVGVTNRDLCKKVYWLIGEVDGEALKEGWLEECVMVVRTRKGYHFYIDYHHANPLRVVHYAIKRYKWLDRGQLRLALMRYRRTRDPRRAFLVLRVSPKYDGPDMRIVHFNMDRASLWHRHVKQAIEFFNT